MDRQGLRDYGWLGRLDIGGVAGMSVTVTDIEKAGTALSLLVARMVEGEGLVAADAKKTLARLIAIESRPRSKVLGQFEGRIEMADDFDEPLPNGFWAADR